MSIAPSLLELRASIAVEARRAASDPVAREALRQGIVEYLVSVRLAITRAEQFAAAGLVSEAASVIEDFPDLARAALTLHELAGDPGADGALWRQLCEDGGVLRELPSAVEAEVLAGLLQRAQVLSEPLDRLRLVAIERRGPEARLTALRALREADPRNRLWLDEIAATESVVLRGMALLAERGGTLEELESAVTALSSRHWAAPIPAGLRERLYDRVRPLRAAVAASRYGPLAEEIHRAAALMDRQELERLEAAWASIQHETGRMPDERLQSAVEPAFAWLASAIAEERAAADFESKVDQLDRALDARAPWTEIDRLLAALRDTGRSVPEGTLARSAMWIATEQDRLRRRHRLIAAGAVGACAVALVGIFVAVRVHARLTEERDAVAKLEQHIAVNDGPAAAALAKALRERADFSSPELVAALAAEEALAGRWSAERARIAGLLQTLEAEVSGAVSRARLVAIDETLRVEAANLRTETERATHARISERHRASVAARDAGDVREIDALASRVDAAVAIWRTPDRWPDREQVDPARWDAYSAEIATLLAACDAARAEVDGHAAQLARISLIQDGLAKRRDEASARRADLAASMEALSPSRIGAGVASEAAFLARLDETLSKHGAVLGRQGSLFDFERAQECGPAWIAIGAWRDEVRPKLEAAMGSGLSAVPTAAAATDAVIALNDYIGRHPGSPYRSRADELLRRIDPAAVQSIWSAERVEVALVAARYDGIEEVPLSEGRFYYRRMSEANRNLLHLAIESAAERLEPPERLNSILLPPGERPGSARTCGASQAWRRAIASAAAAPADGGREVLLGLLSELRAADGDPLLRLACMHEAIDLLVQSGLATPEVERPLRAWLERVGRVAGELALVDWARAPLSPTSEVRTARRTSKDLIDRFPDLAPLIAEAADSRRSLDRELAPLAPIGVLLPARSAGEPRSLGTGTPSGEVVLVIRSGAEWKLVTSTLDAGKLASPPPDLPRGPVLVFRRRAT